MLICVAYAKEYVCCAQAMGQVADQVAEKAVPTAQKITDVAQEQTHKASCGCCLGDAWRWVMRVTIASTFPACDIRRLRDCTWKTCPGYQLTPGEESEIATS